jgi:hypothetical protein
VFNFSDLIKVNFRGPEIPNTDYFIHPPSGEILVRGLDCFEELRLDISDLKQFPRREKIMVREGKKTVSFLGDAGQLRALKMVCDKWPLTTSLPSCRGKLGTENQFPAVF